MEIVVRWCKKKTISIAVYALCEWSDITVLLLLVTYISSNIICITKNHLCCDSCSAILLSCYVQELGLNTSICNAIGITYNSQIIFAN